MLRRLVALSALALAPIALAAQEHQHNPAHHAEGAADPHAPTIVIIERLVPGHIATHCNSPIFATCR